MREFWALNPCKLEVFWDFEDPDAYSMLYNRKKEKFLNSKQIYSYECYTFYALENFFSI